MVWSIIIKKVRSFSGVWRNQRGHQDHLLKFYSFNNVPESHEIYLNGFPHLQAQINRSVHIRKDLYIDLRRFRFLSFCLLDGGRLFNGYWLDWRFNVLFGFVLISHALTGQFVGPRVFDVFGDGLVILALHLRLFVKVHGVLLNAFLDAIWVKGYSDMF